MTKTVNVYLFGKRYAVPENLTIMTAMEYAGYQLKRGCGACTKSCTQGLNVMQYIAYAQRGDFKKCADLSFDCVMCGICSSRCPAGISHPQVAMLARRLNGKYLTPDAQHLLRRVTEIANGEHIESMKEIMGKSDAEIRDMYNKRDIEQ